MRTKLKSEVRSPKSEVQSRQSRRGFTLVELLLVLVILGTLAAIVLPRFSGTTERARETQAKTQIATFGTALDAYEVDVGRYPSGKDGLRSLIEQPGDAQDWKGPYLKNEASIPLDPWGHEYIYECPGKYNRSGYDLSSMGPDGRAGNEDDVANWQDKTERRQ